MGLRRTFWLPDLLSLFETGLKFILCLSTADIRGSCTKRRGRKAECIHLNHHFLWCPMAVPLAGFMSWPGYVSSENGSEMSGGQESKIFIPFYSSGTKLEAFSVLPLYIIFSNSFDTFSAKQCFPLILPLFMNILMPLLLY